MGTFEDFQEIQLIMHEFITKYARHSISFAMCPFQQIPYFW